jgi:hypothetical protein
LRAAPLLLTLAACASSRDVIPESHDVEQTKPASEGGYEYIAKRPLGVVAVAESRGLPREVVTAIADQMANSLDICITHLASEGRLIPAAARVATHIDKSGAPTGLTLTLTPGPGPTATALLCFVSPFKLLRFPSADVDPMSRGIALEASWGAATLATPAPSAAPAPFAPASP